MKLTYYFDNSLDLMAMLSYILQGDHDHANVDVLFRGAHYFLDRELTKTVEEWESKSRIMVDKGLIKKPIK